MQNAFQHILPFPGDVLPLASQPPTFFSDLNLDQLIEAITASRQEYNLKPFFWTPLCDAELVRYRQEVMQDLEHEATMCCIKAFAERMSTVHRYMGLIEKLDFDDHKKGWHLEAALVYGEAVTTLARDLAQLPLASRGLLAFRTWVQEYTASQAFQAFFAEAQQVKCALSELESCVLITWAASIYTTNSPSSTLTFPQIAPPGELRFSSIGLYDPSLAIKMKRRVVENDLASDGKTPIVITGPNQG